MNNTTFSDNGAAFERHRKFRERLVQILQKGAELPAAATTIASLTDAQGYSARDLMIDLAKIVSEDLFRIAVVGEYSSGKSSLLNLLLDMIRMDGRKTEGELPTDIRPTTAVITTIYYSEQPIFEAVFQDGDRMLTTRDKLAAVLSEPERKKREGREDAETRKGDAKAQAVKEVRIGWKSKLLSHGVEVQDTPGLGSVNEDHGEITRRAVAGVDAVIFTMSYDPALGEGELTFLQYVAGFTDKFIFVQNKRDYGDIVENGEPGWKRREREHRRRIAEVTKSEDFPI